MPEWDVPGGHSDVVGVTRDHAVGLDDDDLDGHPGPHDREHGLRHQDALAGGLRDGQRHPHGGVARAGASDVRPGGDLGRHPVRDHALVRDLPGVRRNGVRAGRAERERRAGAVRRGGEVLSPPRRPERVPIGACYASAMRPHVAALLAALGCVSCKTQAADDRPPVTAATIAAAPSSSAAAKSGAPREGDELVGTTPREWTVDHWMNSPPLTLAGLRGRVVLVRWFMLLLLPRNTADQLPSHL